MSALLPGLEKLFILALILGIGYFLFKKITKKEVSRSADLRMISSLPLGQKEKIVVCEFQNKKFIMGVTQQQISHLYTFEGYTPKRSVKTDADSDIENPPQYNPMFT